VRRPIFSADLHSVPPTQHTKPAHPYAKLGATGVEPLAAEDDHARKERFKREDDSKDRDKSWRLATCGGDNNVRVRPSLSPSSPPAAAGEVGQRERARHDDPCIARQTCHDNVLSTSR